ncbi:hypothetical protein C8R47DRAFT_512834 [Mycena vitilis]|nr:hypothetical protein C8R47DRAFT_512834 [Mycena vitilis]
MEPKHVSAEPSVRVLVSDGQYVFSEERNGYIIPGIRRRADGTMQYQFGDYLAVASPLKQDGSEDLTDTENYNGERISNSITRKCTVVSNRSPPLTVSVKSESNPDGVSECVTEIEGDIACGDTVYAKFRNGEWRLLEILFDVAMKGSLYSAMAAILASELGTCIPDPMHWVKRPIPDYYVDAMELERFEQAKSRVLCHFPEDTTYAASPSQWSDNRFVDANTARVQITTKYLLHTARS